MAAKDRRIADMVKTEKLNGRLFGLIGCLGLLLLSSIAYTALDFKDQQEKRNVENIRQFERLNTTLVTMYSSTQEQFKELGKHLQSQLDEIRTQREHGRGVIRANISTIKANHRILDEAFKNHKH